MAMPQVSWYTADNSTQVTQWNIGTVDAGSVSTEFDVLVWNNRGGAGVLSDMTNCTVTTKDQSGGNTGELITNTWIEVKCLSAGESAFSPIGGTTTHAIKGGGAAAAGVISGAVNDGSIANAAANFASLALHANVPGTATAGAVSFITRVAYQYV